MNRIEVKDFGPVRDVKLDLKDFSVFIGPQASGKSTLAKLIYYFLSVKDSIMQFVVETVSKGEKVEQPKAMRNITLNLRLKFASLFGKTKYEQQFVIQYWYSEELYIRVFFDDRNYSIHFSDCFYNRLNKVIDSINSYIIDRNKFPLADSQPLEQFERQKFFEEITTDINNLVGGDERKAIYVPACRSLLSTLSDYILRLLEERYENNSIMPNSVFDYTSREFIEQISDLKKLFTRSFSEIIELWEDYSPEKLDIENLHRIESLIYQILRGEYRYTKDEERLYFSDTDYVKLSHSSSGQQEAVWILQLIFALVLRNTQTTILIEEPEAHLYPEAQMYMVWLIALLGGLKNNRVIITTHSPYILATVNNLLYANKIGNLYKEQVEKIIPAYSWLSFDKTDAFFVDKGEIEPILDKELNQIQAERIDETSDILNKQFSDILQIEIDNEAI